MESHFTDASYLYDYAASNGFNGANEMRETQKENIAEHHPFIPTLGSIQNLFVALGLVENY